MKYKKYRCMCGVKSIDINKIPLDCNSNTHWI